ncbi:MAG TPA: PEP-CTERM sorting domain-containing protein [Cyanobacteria bacterium UBA11366]|nr:PEP-CTERM sorting domain-containing protein [Cyanobacteria bacterium UBA11366]HCA94844.1 PEP-CTERM sorting domain-containing protein [Cyanobacteria bacterium UBA9226]
MQGTIKKILLGASVVAGISGIAGAPAFAGSLTGASVSGVAGTDYYIYKHVGSQTVRDDSASLATVLQGSCTVVAGACNPAGSPGGNVELFANSEKSPLSPGSVSQAFTALSNFLGYNTTTSLTGQIGGKDITLSSLNALDWFGSSAASAKTAIASASAISNPILRAAALNNAINPLYNASNFATQWFENTLSQYGLLPSTSIAKKAAFNTFLLAGGFQRFSDPNISYVNQDNDGLIRIGLAGHYNALDLLGLSGSSPVQVSEVVKVSYKGGPAEYKYSYQAAQSGLTAADDGRSHNGEYEVTLQGDPVAVPEPSAVLGLVTVGGLFAAKRKLNKSFNQTN